MRPRARSLAELAGTFALLGSAACPGLSEDEILDGKPCTAAGECADGYVCDDATERCVRRDAAGSGLDGAGEGGDGAGEGGASGVVAATGGMTGTGGGGTGGAAAGAPPAGGAPTGGDASGGQTTGGAATGGEATGGAATGGEAPGGAPPGGAPAGGASGAPTGGDATGGLSPGGAPPGGAPPGGAPPGGATPGGGPPEGGATGSGGLVPGICGDGVLNTGEECEPNGVDPCTAGCRIDCSLFGLRGGQGTELVLPDGTRHCYYALVITRSFAAANAECATIGGHLATIHSDAENERVRSLLSTYAAGWIGATDGEAASVPTPGTYAWVTDEPFDYEPAGGFDSDPSPCWGSCGHCATIATYGAATWGVAVCTSSLVGVCEWTPPR